MPRAKKTAAPAEAAPVAPAPMPPVPAGALPGAPAQFQTPVAPQQGSFPQFQIPNFAPVAQTIPGAQLAQQAATATALPWDTAPAAPAAPAQVPMAPPAQAPQTDMGAAANLLPQVLQLLTNILEKQAQYHAEVLQAMGQYNQQGSAQHQELKSHFTQVFDHLGGMGQHLQTLTSPASKVPQVTTVQAPFQPNAAPSPVPVPQPAAPQQAAQSVGVHPALAHNPNFGNSGAIEYLNKIARGCVGQHASVFINQIRMTPTVASAFSENDLASWLSLSGLADGAGIIRV